MPDNNTNNGKGDKLIDKFEELRGLYGRYFAALKENRSFYNLEFGRTIVPDEWIEHLEPLVPPTARHAIDEAADHILTTPKVKVPVRPVEGKQMDQQAIAEQKRKFINSFWHTTESLTNPLGTGKKNLLLDGKIAIKKTLRWDLIPEKGNNVDKYRVALAKLGKIEFLWNVEVIPNEYVFEDPNNHRDPEYVYLSYKIRVGEAKRLFPDATGEWKKLGEFEKVEYLEYWEKPKFNPDGTWEPGKYVQWIENSRVHDDDNPYPYVPIAIEDSGYGILTAEPKPEDKYVGFAQNMHEIFKAEAVQMTSWQAVLKMTAFPMITARNIGDEKEIGVGPGLINRLEGTEGEPGSEELRIEKMPEVPLGLLQFVDKTTQIANSALKINVLGGLPQPGVETATESDQNLRNASVKLSYAVSAIERLVKKINRWIFMDIELVLEAPVTMFGAGADSPSEIVLKPMDIKGYYETHVELVTADKDAVNQVNARFWAEMYRVVPFLSLHTAMEKMGLDDPQAEMIKRASEDVFLSEEFRLIRTMTGAQSFGELAQLLQQLQAPQGVGGEGGGANPGSGANSANGLVEQGNLGAPIADELTRNSLTRRDVLRGDSQLR